MKTLLVIPSLVILVSTMPVREVLREVDGVTWKYVVDDRPNKTFEEARSWCHSMSAELPAIHSQEDMDFLADTVIVQNSPGSTSTWIGLKAENSSCSVYTDGSPADFTFTSWLPLSLSCHVPDEALVMWNDGDHKTVFMEDASFREPRVVCVIKLHKLLSTTPSSTGNITKAPLEERVQDNLERLRETHHELMKIFSRDMELKHSQIWKNVSTLGQETEAKLKNISSTIYSIEMNILNNTLTSILSRITADTKTWQSQSITLFILIAFLVISIISMSIVMLMMKTSSLKTNRDSIARYETDTDCVTLV